MTEDTWIARDFPIIEAVVATEGPNDITVGQLASLLSMEQREVILGVRALKEASYLSADPVYAAEEFLPLDYHDIRPLERGRRAVGQWPSEDAYEDFFATIERAIEDEPDGDERTRLERVRDFVATTGKTVWTGLLLEYLKQRAGLA
jgi:hypothetical protein